MRTKTKSEINWDDKYLSRWLKSKKQSTGYTYKLYFAHYLRWSKMTAEQLIMEKWADQKLEPIERSDVAENRVREFNRWLIEDAVQRKEGKKGYAPKTALAVCASIQDFFSHNGVPLNIKLTREFAGSVRGLNESEKMSANQIAQLASYAPTRRDKAIIWCMFQSGMDISTVLNLDWGHIEKEIAAPPMDALMLKGLERKKERGRTFSTLIYKTAIRTLRIYLENEFGKDYAKTLKYDTPLFQSRVGERHQAQYVQKMLRDIAPDAGLTTEGKLRAADINPLRPHALRASFSDQMAKAGASKQLTDYLMGHKLQHDTAYFGGESGLRSAYVRYASLALEPSAIESVDESVKTLTADLQVQLSQKDREIRELRDEVQMVRKYVVAAQAQTHAVREYVTAALMSMVDAGLLPKGTVDEVSKKLIDTEPIQGPTEKEKEHEKT